MWRDKAKKKKGPTNNGFDYAGEASKQQIIEKFMTLAGDEARKHSIGGKAFPPVKKKIFKRSGRKQHQNNSSRDISPSFAHPAKSPNRDKS